MRVKSLKLLKTVTKHCVSLLFVNCQTTTKIKRRKKIAKNKSIFMKCTCILSCLQTALNTEKMHENPLIIYRSFHQNAKM